MDDTIVAFKRPDHIEKFLTYINDQHRNIKFTVEKECNNALPFLDTHIHNNETIKLEIFRKRTFTPLGISFFSYAPLIFKVNAVRTLLFRAYNICSDYASIHNELVFLKNYFYNNGFPETLISSIIRKFFNNIFDNRKKKLTAEKLKIYISLPYFGYQSEKMKKELYKTLSSFYTFVNFQIILANNNKLGNHFGYKDKLPIRLRSSNIYIYKCACCQTAQYVGCSSRCFQIRIDEHIGVSSRTGYHYAKPPFSAIRDHAENHGRLPSANEFQILHSANSEFELKILESLYISKIKPNLNNMNSSIPLLIS